MKRETMNLVAPLLLTSHLFIASFVDAGKVVLMDPNITRSFDDVEASFSPSMNATGETGVLYVAEPLDACQNLRNKPKQSHNGTSPFVLIVRGGCNFAYKVRNAQRSGFKAAIVHDDVDRDILVEMRGGYSDGIKIQAVFVTKAAGETLKKYVGLTETKVLLVPSVDDSAAWSLFATIALIVSLVTFVVLTACVYVYRRSTTHINNAISSKLHGMSRTMVKAMPSVTFTCLHSRDCMTTAFSCAICLEDYTVGDKLRVLPCGHKFHAACVDSWLTSWRTFCPVCKRDARASSNEPSASERTPLLRSSIESPSSSSVVVIDPPRVGSSLTFSPGHMSSSYIHQSFRQQTSPFHSSSQRSYITCMGSLHSSGYSSLSPLNANYMPPYRASPSNASPGLVQSTNHRFNSLLCRESAGSLSPFSSAHSFETVKTKLPPDTIEESVPL